jgi:hypothetical protein
MLSLLPLMLCRFVLKSLTAQLWCLLLAFGITFPYSARLSLQAETQTFNRCFDILHFLDVACGTTVCNALETERNMKPR